MYDASYALVVGIDKYTNGWPRLSNAVKDAELVARELEDRGFNVTLHRNLNSAELKSALEEFYILKGNNPNSRLFFWFAGHGATISREGFIVPADAPTQDSDDLFKLKALSMRRFGEYVRLAKSKHAYAVFDSCFAGTIFSTQRSKPPAAITRATTLPVRQFLASGDEKQQVSDDGTFRKLFIRALKGEERADLNSDGYISGSELGMFLDNRLTNLTNARQTPRYGKLQDMDYDRGDFIFLAGGPPLANVESLSFKKNIPTESLQSKQINESTRLVSNDKIVVAVNLFKSPSGLTEEKLRRDLELLLVEGLKNHHDFYILENNRLDGNNTDNWQKNGIDYVVLVKSESDAKNILIEARVVNVEKDQMILGRRYRGSIDNQRAIISKLAEAIIGEFVKSLTQLQNEKKITGVNLN